MEHHAPKPRTSELLHDIATDPSTPTVVLGEIIDRFGARAFGLLVIIAALPTLIPSPIGVGGISGALIVICGMQMLWGMEHPWLPKGLRNRGLPSASVHKFVVRLEPWLKRIEKLCRARWIGLLERTGTRFTGLLLIFQGLGLALPIPFTNYPYGLVLLLVAFALIEGDGLLLAVSWGLMLATLVAMAGLSGVIFEALRSWM